MAFLNGRKFIILVKHSPVAVILCSFVTCCRHQWRWRWRGVVSYVRCYEVLLAGLVDCTVPRTGTGSMMACGNVISTMLPVGSQTGAVSGIIR